MSIKTIPLPSSPGYKCFEYSKKKEKKITAGVSKAFDGKRQTKPRKAMKTCCCKRKAKRARANARTRKALCTARRTLTKQKGSPVSLFRYLPPLFASLWIRRSYNNNLRGKIKKQIIFLHIIPLSLSSAWPQFDNLISWESKCWKFKLPRVLIAALLHC